MNKRYRQREATAFHEAGHAVAAIRLGVGLGRHGVTIEPGEGYHGRCHALKGFAGSPEYGISPTKQVRIENRVIVLLCGPAAQRRHRASSIRSHHPRADYHGAVDLLSYLGGSDRTLEKHFTYLAARADDFVASRTNWPMITAVAKELLKRVRLSNADVRRIFIESAAREMRRVDAAGSSDPAAE